MTIGFIKILGFFSFTMQHLSKLIRQKILRLWAVVVQHAGIPGYHWQALDTCENALRCAMCSPRLMTQGTNHPVLSYSQCSSLVLKDDQPQTHSCYSGIKRGKVQCVETDLLI